jgi:hypothetical protein
VRVRERQVSGPSWRERILAARERGGFTDAEKARACADWTTCAVGEQIANGVVTWVDVHGQWEDGVGCVVGRDGELRRLGLWFGEAVDTDDMDRAEALLEAIESRALAVKRAGGGA